MAVAESCENTSRPRSATWQMGAAAAETLELRVNSNVAAAANWSSHTHCHYALRCDDCFEHGERCKRSLYLALLLSLSHTDSSIKSKQYSYLRTSRSCIEAQNSEKQEREGEHSQTTVVLSRCAYTALYSSSPAAESAASSSLVSYRTSAKLASSVERDQVLQRVAVLLFNTELSAVADLFVAPCLYVMHSTLQLEI
eukprot:19196-Heterococcus_DN1.PRE.1